VENICSSSSEISCQLMPNREWRGITWNLASTHKHGIYCGNGKKFAILPLGL